MKLVDHYPEILRDIYDKIEDLIIDAGQTSSTVDIALYVTEWIREHWSGRYLLRTWWCHLDGSADTTTGILPAVKVQVDQLRTVRGREFRDVVLSIVLTKIQSGRPCYLAVAIAELVEKEWSTKKIYVPFGANVDRAIKDLQIWQDFGGGMADIEKVVAKHNICQTSIYEAFRRVQDAKKEREQPKLPGF